MSTGTDPDELTLANVKDGIIKYKTLRKDKLQLLCGTLLDHIEDHEAKFVEAYVKEAEAKAKAIGKIDQIITVQRAEIEELKEAVFVSNASNVELRAELRELKESAFVSSASDASNGEDNVRAELRELKEAVAVSNASNVELRAELRELKESAFVSSASDT
jgi:endo-alpha-1,4-polygalactosaminidase (GH114 family)